MMRASSTFATSAACADTMIDETPSASTRPARARGRRFAAESGIAPGLPILLPPLWPSLMVSRSPMAGRDSPDGDLDSAEIAEVDHLLQEGGHTRQEDVLARPDLVPEAVTLVASTRHRSEISKVAAPPILDN